MQQFLLRAFRFDPFISSRSPMAPAADLRLRLFNIEAFLANLQGELAEMLDEFRSESRKVKIDLHEAFHKLEPRYEDLHGIAHETARLCLMRCCSTYVVAGGPLSNPDLAHRAIECLTILTRFPHVLDDYGSESTISITSQRAWMCRALHDWCASATKLYNCHYNQYVQIVQTPFPLPPDTEDH